MPFHDRRVHRNSVTLYSRLHSLSFFFFPYWNGYCSLRVGGSHYQFKIEFPIESRAKAMYEDMMIVARNFVKYSRSRCHKRKKKL